MKWCTVWNRVEVVDSLDLRRKITYLACHRSFQRSSLRYVIVVDCDQSSNYSIISFGDGIGFVLRTFQPSFHFNSCGMFQLVIVILFSIHFYCFPEG